MYKGDYLEDSVVYHMWDTYDGKGGSILPTTSGYIYVYKDNGTSPAPSGVSDIRNFNSIIGVHNLRVDTGSHSFYTAGNDYMVVLSGAVIDGNTVNAALCSFSIQNRNQNPTSNIGIDWSNVSNQNSIVNLTNTSINSTTNAKASHYPNG